MSGQSIDIDIDTILNNVVNDGPPTTVSEGDHDEIEWVTQGTWNDDMLAGFVPGTWNDIHPSQIPSFHSAAAPPWNPSPAFYAQYVQENLSELFHFSI